MPARNESTSRPLVPCPSSLVPCPLSLVPRPLPSRSLVPYLQEESAKAQGESNLMNWRIDGIRRSRYSQAQIPHLVAIANPSPRKAAPHSGRALPCVAGILFKSRICRQPDRRKTSCAPAWAGILALAAQNADTFVVVLPRIVLSSHPRSTSTLQHRPGGHIIL